MLCNVFLIHRLAERNEIWHNEFSELWPTFPGRGGVVKIWESGYLAELLLERHKIGRVRVLASWQLFPEFHELWSGFPRYLAATCVSPSLVHLFVLRSCLIFGRESKMAKNYQSTLLLDFAWAHFTVLWFIFVYVSFRVSLYIACMCSTVRWTWWDLSLSLGPLLPSVLWHLLVGSFDP